MIKSIVISGLISLLIAIFVLPLTWLVSMGSAMSTYSDSSTPMFTLALAAIISLITLIPAGIVSAAKGKNGAYWTAGSLALVLSIFVGKFVGDLATL
jgi:hypothetical protein